MERQLKTGDFRERVFQDNIIRPFLQSVFPELDIEPVDVKTATNIHQHEQYCGADIVDNRKTIGTPDLCISDEWYWDNKNKNVNYRGVVEIKSPILDSITGFVPKEYKKHTLDEIERYLTAERNSKIILTDGFTWTFYDKENGINPIREPICIGTITYKRDRGHNNRLVYVYDDSGNRIIEKINFETEEKFDELKQALKCFICEDK